MNTETKFESVLTVRSFAYVAKQLARTPEGAPAARYEQILGEADKHRSALRLLRRDAFDTAAQGQRDGLLTRAEAERIRQSAIATVAQAEHLISRIAAQYAPQRLAA
ncbi:hypothetical protein E4K72_02420 [Oxalobacteraceae bacterium OM1]|nr:hypothetical protein E4K72_02420 [Oxalobacteraceae bacterium OM1]